ncbi:MAG: membrane protein insertion efficiency factor YidD [Rhodospirillaceae bacterium]|nr:membrane protein insertion efficiency factor YidD [Rhodospirillaceae bacterium]
MAARIVVRGYQLFISPILPGSCRFYPSCSNYALDAITTHGTIRGSWLAVCRIARCHPWGTSGFDPVPGSSLHKKTQVGSDSCNHAH